MKTDFRGSKYVTGMGKTIEEKMKEYNEMKGTIQNYSKNKETYKNKNNNELAKTPWGKVLLVAFVCILLGSLVLYLGVNNLRRSIANHDDRLYIWAEIEDIRFGTGSYETRLELEYEVDGKIYTDYMDTNKTRDEFMRGQRMNVYYYKGNPSRVYSTAQEVGNIFAPIVGVIFIIVGFVSIFAKIKAGNIKRRK